MRHYVDIFRTKKSKEPFSRVAFRKLLRRKSQNSFREVHVILIWPSRINEWPICINRFQNGTELYRKWCLIWTKNKPDNLPSFYHSKHIALTNSWQFYSEISTDWLASPITETVSAKYNFQWKRKIWWPENFPKWNYYIVQYQRWRIFHQIYVEYQV